MKRKINILLGILIPMVGIAEGVQEERIYYFEKPGKHNTDTLVKIVANYIEKNNISYVVVASTSGFTAKKVIEEIKNKDVKIIVVGEKKKSFDKQIEKEVKKRKGEVIYAYSGEVKYNFPSAAIGAFYRFCQGMKVCVEIVMIACNASVLKEGEKVVAIAGTAYGADTAILIEGRKSENIWKIKIQKIIAKPL
jgi:hypothetical protein